MSLRTLILLPLLAACAPEPPSGLADAAQAGWSIDPGADMNAFFDCLSAEGIALVAAHRGGPAPGFPENAVETFAQTLILAPALMEIDVAASADGVLFLLHDDALDRTTSGDGTAAEQDWSAIGALRLEDPRGARTAFSPPRLADALAFANGRTILEIDFKRSAKYEDVLAEIRAAGMETRVILIAYSLAQARKLHRLAPEMMISLSIASVSDLNAAVAGGIPADRLLAFTGLAEPDRRLLPVLQARGVEAILGTLGADGIDRAIAQSGEDPRYADIAAAGVDLIATDRPVAAYAALEAAGRGARDGVCGVSRR